MDFDDRTTEDVPLPTSPIQQASPQPGTAPSERSVAARPHRRAVLLPAFLFVATCLSTFYVGSLIDEPPGVARYVETQTSRGVMRLNVHGGLVYMTAVMSILVAHEMGHFLQAVRYHVPASLPYFIPMPFSPLGTFGAVIGMPGTHADRRQMFDIGITGPLAGLVVALPIVWLGLKEAPVVAASPDQLPGHAMMFGDPLLFKFLFRVLRPDQPPDAVFGMTPLVMAGWVGLFVTGLNMLPISQLDGGHVAYALLLRKAHILARSLLVVAAIAMVLFELYSWVMIFLLVLLIGADHPPTRNDDVSLGPVRRWLGYATLTLPIFCLTPVPITFQ